ncbi:glycosyltransferase family 2 protein [Nocardioides dilutus]
MSRYSHGPLVSIALPVYNGAATLTPAIESALAQTYPDIELVISDNGSTDGTEEICRHFARADRRVVYKRHPTNIGMLNNFTSAARTATGTYLRWLGDDDSLEPSYVARTLETFGEDERRVLVTTQIVFVGADGTETLVTDYDPSPLSSPDPGVRFAEMMRLLTTDLAVLDPLYGMLRRDSLLVPRKNTLREDEIFAARLALAGPWGHVPQALARRPRSVATAAVLPRMLGVPAWHWHIRAVQQCRELSYWIAQSSLEPAQRRRARADLVRMYARRKRNRMQRGLVRLGGALGPSAQEALGRSRRQSPAGPAADVEAACIPPLAK